MSDLYISPWMQALLLPKRWDICGIEVKPLSIWHLFILEQLKNPYVCGGIPDKDAISTLILYTERDFKEGTRIFKNHVYREKVLKQIYKRIKPIEWESLHNACLDFVKACTRVPDHKYPEDSKSKSLAAPYQFHLIGVLCPMMNLSLDATWNLPYAEAKCYYDAAAERGGDDTLCNLKSQIGVDKYIEDEMRAKEKNK